MYGDNQSPILSNSNHRTVVMKHIHIVGCLPRSGTTLLTELMVNCFAIDGYTDHEHSIFKEYSRPCNILCTKKPSDIKRVKFPLRVNDQLYVIYMLRDPRDAISSRSHQNNRKDKSIWGNLQTWINHQQIADELARNPRFITVRYEDLAAAPDQVQDYLASRLPFLVKKISFSEFHRVATPSEKTAAALGGGARPISTASIGNWRNHKPFIKAQIEKYGDISHLLERLTYEENSDWLNELANVDPDNSEEPMKIRSGFRQCWEKWFTMPRRNLYYWISTSKLVGPGFNNMRYRLRGLPSLIRQKLSRHRT